jgi:hypothetical protein
LCSAFSFLESRYGQDREVTVRAITIAVVVLGVALIGGPVGAQEQPKERVSSPVCSLAAGARPPHVEIIRFVVSGPETSTFVSGIANVLDRDEVYLRVHNVNPLKYRVVFTQQVDTTPARPFLVTLGTLPAGASGLVGKAATEAAEQTVELEEDIEAARADAERTGKAEVRLRAWALDIAGRLPTQVREALSTLDKELTAVEAAFQQRSQAMSAAVRAIRLFSTELENLKRRVAVVEELGERALESGETLLGKYKEFHAELTAQGPAHTAYLGASESMTKLQDAEARLAEAWSDAARLRLEGLEKAAERVVESLPAPTIEGGRAALRDHLDRLKVLRAASAEPRAPELLVALRTAVDGAAGGLLRASRHAADVDGCFRLGTYESGQRVVLTAEVQERQAPPEIPAREDSGGNGNGNGNGEETTGNESTATRITPRLHFDVLTPTHLRGSIGAVVTSLASPTFGFRTEPDKDDSSRQLLTVFRREDPDIQVRPIVQLALYLVPQYFWADAEEGDDSETVRARWWHRVYPTVGFSLTEPTENLFVGGGIDIARGISINAGTHFGRVQRLLQGYVENEARSIPTDPAFEIDRVVESGFRRGFYLSVGIDPAAFAQLFGGSEE